MDERAARDVIAVRAIETSDRSRVVWTDVDRAWATRAAAEVVTASACDEAFVIRRATLVLERLHGRHAAFVRAIEALRWRPWISPAILIGAFILGLAADRIGGTQSVNILAPPVLGIVVWNLLVYVGLAVRSLARLRRRRASEGAIRRLVHGLSGAVAPHRRIVGPAPLTAALRAFVVDWGRAAAPLYAARTARLLHLAAAALALGVIVGMYARGLAFEYRASWQSTFLDPMEVHRLVDIVLTPASRVTGIAIPSVERIAALRSSTADGGENAAPWLHLYAATLALVVLLPRTILATVAGAIEHRIRSRMPVGLDDAYFGRLVRSFREGPLRIRVVPYSFAPPAGAIATLEAVLTRAYGRCEIAIAAPVEYGAEDAPSPSLNPMHVNLVIALFNATATPETATHGAFIAALHSAANGAECLAVVDESAFRARWPHDESRLEQRRLAWRDLAAARAPVIFVHLAEANVEASAANLERVLEAFAAQHGR